MNQKTTSTFIQHTCCTYKKCLSTYKYPYGINDICTNTSDVDILWAKIAIELFNFCIFKEPRNNLRRCDTFISQSNLSHGLLESAYSLTLSQWVYQNCSLIVQICKSTPVSQGWPLCLTRTGPTGSPKIWNNVIRLVLCNWMGFINC